jgi:hypothetical protein
MLVEKHWVSYIDYLSLQILASRVGHFNHRLFLVYNQLGNNKVIILFSWGKPVTIDFGKNSTLPLSYLTLIPQALSVLHREIFS